MAVAIPSYKKRIDVPNYVGYLMYQRVKVS